MGRRQIADDGGIVHVTREAGNGISGWDLERDWWHSDFGNRSCRCSRRVRVWDSCTQEAKPMSDELDKKAIEAHADIVFDRMVRNVLRLILCVGLPIAIVVGAYF